MKKLSPTNMKHFNQDDKIINLVILLFSHEMTKLRAHQVRLTKLRAHQVTSHQVTGSPSYKLSLIHCIAEIFAKWVHGCFVKFAWFSETQSSYGYFVAS